MPHSLEHMFLKTNAELSPSWVLHKCMLNSAAMPTLGYCDSSNKVLYEGCVIKDDLSVLSTPQAHLCSFFVLCCNPFAVPQQVPPCVVPAYPLAGPTECCCISSRCWHSLHSTVLNRGWPWHPSAQSCSLFLPYIEEHKEGKGASHQSQHLQPSFVLSLRSEWSFCACPDTAVADWEGEALKDASITVYLCFLFPDVCVLTRYSERV